MIRSVGALDTLFLLSDSSKKLLTLLSGKAC